MKSQRYICLKRIFSVQYLKSLIMFKDLAFIQIVEPSMHSIIGMSGVTDSLAQLAMFFFFSFSFANNCSLIFIFIYFFNNKCNIFYLKMI